MRVISRDGGLLSGIAPQRRVQSTWEYSHSIPLVEMVRNDMFDHLTNFFPSRDFDPGLYSQYRPDSRSSKKFKVLFEMVFFWEYLGHFLSF